MSLQHSERSSSATAATVEATEPTSTPAGADVRSMIAQSGGDPHRLAELIIASGGLSSANMLNALHAQLGTQNALRVTSEVLRIQNRQSQTQSSPAEANGTPAGQPSAPAGANATTAPDTTSPQTQAGPQTPTSVPTTSTSSSQQRLRKRRPRRARRRRRGRRARQPRTARRRPHRRAAA